MIGVVFAVGNVAMAQEYDGVNGAQGVEVTTSSETYSKPESDKSKLDFPNPDKGVVHAALDGGFSWLMGRDDFKKHLQDFNFDVHVGLGAVYGLTDNLALSGTIGYRYNCFSSENKNNSNYDYKFHYITLPIHLRYYFPNSKFGVFGGVRFNFAVSGKFERKEGGSKETIKWSDIKKLKDYNGTETDLEFGIMINSWCIKYGFSVSEVMKDYKTQYITLGLEI